MNSKTTIIGVAVLTASCVGIFISSLSQTVSASANTERFVQVNGYGQWRGFEVTGDKVHWLMSCGRNQPLHWKNELGGIGVLLKDFDRESPLIFTHPSLGDFAKVDNFEDAEIQKVTAEMRIILGRWTANREPGEVLVGCEEPTLI